PFAPTEREFLAERAWLPSQFLLQIALDAVLVQRGRIAHVVRDVTQDLDKPDLEPLVAFPLANYDRVVARFDYGRRRHPVQRLVTPRVVVDEERSVSLEHQQPH